MEIYLGDTQPLGNKIWISATYNGEIELTCFVVLENLGLYSLLCWGWKTCTIFFKRDVYNQHLGLLATAQGRFRSVFSHAWSCVPVLLLRDLTCSAREQIRMATSPPNVTSQAFPQTNSAKGFSCICMYTWMQDVREWSLPPTNVCVTSFLQ